MDRLSEFRNACLAYLEEESTLIPALEGMTPEEQEKGRRWLRLLGQTRDDYELVCQRNDRYR